MGVVVRLDEEGRLALPVAAREALGLRPGDEVEVVTAPGSVGLRRPKRPITDLVGFLKHDGPPVSLREMDEGIEEAILEARAPGWVRL